MSLTAFQIFPGYDRCIKIFKFAGISIRTKRLCTSLISCHINELVIALFIAVIDKALFPRPRATDPVPDTRHLQELERIHSELTDHKAIEKPARTWGQAMHNKSTTKTTHKSTSHRTIHKQRSHDSDRSEPFTGDDYW